MIYEHCGAAVEHEFPIEFNNGNWGCQLIDDNDIDMLRLKDLKKYYPHGKLVTTLDCHYWIWKSVNCH